MKRQCPSCKFEYVPATPRCPHCGIAGTVALNHPAEEPAAESQGLPLSQQAPRVGTGDLSWQSSAQKVKPLGGRKDDGAEAGASGDVGEAKPEPSRAHETFDAAAFYRSIRTLAIANVVTLVLAMATIITLVVNHNSSMERASNNAQENLRAAHREHAEAQRETIETATSKATEPLVAELQRVKGEQRQQLKDELTEDARIAGRDAARYEVAEARLNLLPPALNVTERRTISREVAKAVSGTNDKKVQSALQKVVDKTDRRAAYAAYKDAAKLIPNPDGPTKAVIDKVGKTILVLGD